MTKRPLVLVVEDEESIRNQLADAIPLIGYDVILVASGAEAIDKLSEFKPDIILSDIRMPGMSGLELKKRLDETGLAKGVPFVFLSALSGYSQVREGMSMAADDYLTKPYRLHTLKEVIDTQLKKAAQRSGHIQEMISTISESLQLIFPHEIITPITVIHGMADFMRTLDPQNPSDVKIMREMTESILESSNRLRELTDKFTVSVQSSLHSLENQKGVLTESFDYDIADLAQQTVDRVSRSLNSKSRIHSHFEPGMTNVLKQIVERLVTEILRNAIEYSPEHEDVLVSGREVDGAYVISIEDRGPGMTREQINNIGHFVQFGRKTREQQGVGLGLSISKRLIELIGGMMTFDHRTESGLSVRIHIPTDVRESPVNK